MNLGLKEFYYSIEDKYYAFVEWLANNGLNLKPLISAIETRGVPSLPVFIGFVLIIIGGVYLASNPDALTGLQGTGGPAILVRVQTTSGEPVQGAMVNIAGVGVNQTSFTDAGGTTSFAGIPGGRGLLISVSKQGFGTATRSFVSGQPLPPLVLSTASSDQATLLVVTEDSAPVPGAQVSYIAGGQTRNTVTSTQGIAQLSVSIGQQVSVTVNGNGYDAATETFTPSSPGYQHQVVLHSSLGSISNFGALAANSRRVPSPLDDDETNAARSIDLSAAVTIHADVVDAAGAPIPSATVVLFNFADQSELAAGQTNANGRATFTEISSGIQAYVAVDADGFVSQTSAPRVLQQGTTFTVTMPVVSDISASNLTVTFSDDAASSAFSNDVFILDAATHAVIKKLDRRTGRQRRVESLPAGQNVYLSVFSNQHVRYASESFTLQAGDSNEFDAVLTKKTDENAVDLRVEVVDFYNRPVSNVFVTPFLASNGRGLHPSEKTSAGGVLLRNLPLQEIILKASNESFYGNTSVELTSEIESATVQILPIFGEARLRAIDIFTGSAVAGSSYSVTYQQGDQFIEIAGCPPTAIDNGLCVLTLASGITYTLRASAPNFFDKVQTFVLEPNHASEVDVALVPATSDSVLPRGSFAILDKDGENVFEYPPEEGTGLIILKAGEIYTAVFNVLVRQGSQKAGAYLRMGDEGSIGNALIFKGFPLDDPQSINNGAFDLQGASSFSAGGCGNAIAPNQVGALKWLDASIPASKYPEFGINPASDAVVQVKIPFLVTKSTPNRLNVSFRAYNVLSDGSYARSPADPILGAAAEVAGKKQCAADAYGETFKVASAADQIVQCSSNACLTLRFAQGQRTGVEGFEARPAVTSETGFPNPLFLHYSILDFAPNFDDGTELLFRTDKNFVAVLQTSDQLPPENAASFVVNTGENAYKAVFKTPARGTGGIQTYPTLQRDSMFSINLVYGNKVNLQTSINLVGLPQQVAELAALPPHYTLLYQAENGQDELSLLFTDPSTGQTTNAQSMRFYTDPLFPADAVLLVFNFSAAPCQELIFNLFDESSCFEQVNDPRASLSLPDEYTTYGDDLIMYKYDASTEACSLHSKNPNTVKRSRRVANLRVVSACTQRAIEIPFDVRVSPEIVTAGDPREYPEFDTYDFDKEYHALTLQPRVWEEQAVPDLGVDSSYIHVLVNNRQYSADNFVRIYQGTTEQDAQNFYILDNALVVPVQSARPIATYEQTLSPLLGISTEDPAPAQALRVFDPRVLGSSAVEFLLPNETRITLSIESQAESMEASRTTYLNVLKNTAFRRRQDCNPPRPCPFGMFPYSAFVDIQQKPGIYHLGGDLWTGRFGSGKVDFAFHGLTGTECSTREQEGVYDYLWQYRIRSEDGNAEQLKKFEPLAMGPLDYATFGCSREQQLCGKLSFNGGQCINNCGDGWYFDAYPGLQSRICSGHNFKVEDVRDSSGTQRGALFERWWKNMPNALISCFAQEYAGAYAGCAVGSQFGPVGGLVGTRLGAFVAGQAYDAVLADKINDVISFEPVQGDVPGFTTFLGKWAQACSYAGTALDVANAISSLKGVAALGEYECPGAFDYAASACFCYSSLGGFDPECAAERSIRSVVSSNAFREANTHIHEVAGDVATAQASRDAAGATLQRRTAAAIALDACKTCDDVEIRAMRMQFNGELRSPYSPAERQLTEARLDSLEKVEEARRGSSIIPGTEPSGEGETGGVYGADEDLREAVGRAKASGLCSDTDDIAKCTEKMKEIDGKLGGLDSAVGAVCGPLLTTASAAMIIGSVAADAPQRAYIAINNEGNTNFGGTLGITGPDVDCVDNTDTSRQNLDVWMDLDFSSLRVKEDSLTRCMDESQIAAFATEDIGSGIEPRDKSVSFFITSRG